MHVVCEQLLPLWWWFINIILSSLLQCYRSCRYKGLEKRTCSKSKSKSKSIAFKSKSKSKSKSSKNGLKSGLESKSGLEYYKSGSEFNGITETLLVEQF